METVLYIWLIILYLWLACPRKDKETLGNQPKKGFKYIEIPVVQLVYQPPIKLVEIPIVKLQYQPKVTVTVAKTPKRTVASMRLQVRDLGIKGSARMNKAQLEYILDTH
jgi:hypothetical protein